MTNVRIDQYPLKANPVTADYVLIQDSQDLDVNGIRKYKKAYAGSMPENNSVIGSFTRAEIQALITDSSLTIGGQYIITNAVGDTLELVVRAVSETILDEIAVNNANGENYKYDIVTDTAILIVNPIALGSANQILGVNNAGNAQEYKTFNGTTNQIAITNNPNSITLSLPQSINTNSNVQFGNITGAQFIKSGGLASQFLKADGSVDSSTYLTANQSITLSGEASGSGATSISVTLSNSAVLGKILTGLSITGSAIVSTDSMLTAFGKLQNQLNALVGGVNYRGTWNANTNSPSLSSGAGTQGYYYVVSVAGSTNLDGITDWKLGDWAIYNGTAWQKVDNTDAVVSVNGYTGIVNLSASDVGALPTSAISGTTGKLAKFTSATAVGDSIMSDSGGVITIDGDLYLNSSSTTRARIVSSDNTLFRGYVIGAALGDSTEYAYFKYKPQTGELRINGSPTGFGGFTTFYNNNVEALKITTTNTFITNGAAATGEHFIVGGTFKATGAATFSSSVTATKATLTALPTSPSGLSAGDLWNDSGTVKIV